MGDHPNIEEVVFISHYHIYINAKILQDGPNSPKQRKEQNGSQAPTSRTNILLSMDSAPAIIPHVAQQNGFISIYMHYSF